MAETHGGRLAVKGRAALVEQKQAEEAAKRVVPKDTVAHKKGELRHIGGVMEDPHASGEANATLDQRGETQINASTRRTYESVVFREYNALQGIVSGDATLQRAVADIKKGVPVPTLTAIAAAQGLTADQLLFYADFTAGAHFAKNKLDTPAAVLTQCSLYMSRTDHLLTASQIATRQLKALQSAANADVVDFQIDAEKKGFEGDVFIYDQNGQPATSADMKKKHRGFFQRGIFASREEKAAIKRAKEGEKQKKDNEKKDENMRYGGVRFLRSTPLGVTALTSGDIPLTAASAYERQIVGATAPGEALHGADDMRRYGQRIHSIIEARVDIYRSFGMDLGDVNARVFDVSVTAAGTTLTERSNRYGFFDIERAGLTPDQQRVRAQEQSIAKTKKDIDKQREDQKKAQREKALGAEKNKWKRELGEVSEDETKKNEDESKRLNEEKKKLEEKKSKTDELIQLDKDRQESEKRKTEVMHDTGIVQGDIDEYRAKGIEIATAQTAIDEQSALVTELEEQRDSTLEMATKLRKKVRMPDGSFEETPDDASATEARALQVRVAQAKEELKVRRTTKRDKEKERDDIVGRHKDTGATQTLMDELITTEDAIKTKEAQIAASRTGLAIAAGAPLPTSTEDLQKEIEKYQKQIAEIGQDRLQDRQVEMLATYEEMIASIDAQNERLQQHMAGELADVPDVPHLSGYPRMYLRTLQILFGEDIVLPGNEALLKKYTQLVTPDDFVQQANATLAAGLSVFDPRLVHPSEAMLQMEYNSISDTLLGKIRAELDYRVIHHTLGGTPEDIRRYEMTKLLQKVEPDDAAKLVIDVAIATVPARIDLDAMSRDAYYGDTPEELAYQLMRVDPTLNMGSQVDQMAALYLAQRIIKNRKARVQI